MKNLSYNKIQFLVEQLTFNHSFLPFSKLILAFCHELSQLLITDINLRSNPDIVALGFWLRSSHIQKLKQDFEKSQQLKLSRGLVFHITPGNVDTMFAYSWLISLLVGNKNIVRLSAKSGKVQQQLVSIINNLLVLPSFAEIKQNNELISYQHDDEITAYLSSQCDVRVIWGGDETIKTIQKFPLNARAKEIVFADRFSFALFKADEIEKCFTKKINNKQNLEKLCQLFYRDVFTFGQQACSSPRLLVWVGSNAQVKQAQSLFWRKFKNILEEKDPPSAPAVMNKLVHSQLMAIQDNSINANFVNNDLAPYLSRISVSTKQVELWKQHCGEGLLYEAVISDLKQLNHFVSSDFQTCSYFGFSKDELTDAIVSFKLDHVLRYVPIGQALDFDTIWDGMDLLNEFSKQILMK